MKRSSSPPRASCLAAGAFVLSLSALTFAGAACAEIVSVGGEGCSYGTVQAAINDLSPTAANEIRIANSGDAENYTAQAIRIEGRNLVLRGGYETCQSDQPTQRTTLSGAGGEHNSVVTITGLSDVRLENLLITGGDETSADKGGGIDFDGAGRVTLSNVEVSNNYAGYGGGISVVASGGDAELYFGARVLVMSNTAQYSGGGVRVEGSTAGLARLKMLGDATASTIAFNQALGVNPSTNEAVYGNGGGIQVLNRARADIGSPGALIVGAVSNNKARRGGGISLHGGRAGGASVRVFAADPDWPATIDHNIAELEGGAFYQRGYFDNGDDIANGTTTCLYNARVLANQAVDGAVVYTEQEADGPDGSLWGNQFHVNPGGPCGPESLAEIGAVDCPAGKSCSEIADNRTADLNGQPTQGALIHLRRTNSAGGVTIIRMRMHDNVAGRGVVIFSTFSGSVAMRNLLLTGNQFTKEPLYLEITDDALLDNLTIADNVIGGGYPVIRGVNATLNLRYSVIDQADSSLFSHQGDGGSGAVYTIASSPDHLPPDPSNRVAAPRFVDRARGDYHLQAASPGVDAALTVDGDDPLDLERQPRDKDIERVIDDYGPRDLGAYERQTLQPLVLNGDFDRDLNLWWWGATGTTLWDADNTAGAGASGSTKAVLTPGASGDWWAQSQCFFLPGPGDYHLTGFAHSSGGTDATMDRPRLHWQLRSQASEQWCSDTAVTRFGDVFFPPSNTWVAPAASDTISIPNGEWTPTSSLTVYLLVTEGQTPETTSAWFDGIALLPGASGSDTIFADGFDP